MEKKKKNNNKCVTQTEEDHKEGILLPLVKQVDKLVQTKSAGLMTFMEWLQDTADYDVIERVYSKEGKPYLVQHKDKQNECNEHALFLIRQAKHQLTTQACATVLDTRLLELEDINS